MTMNFFVLLAIIGMSIAIITEFVSDRYSKILDLLVFINQKIEDNNKKINSILEALNKINGDMDIEYNQSVD